MEMEMERAYEITFIKNRKALTEIVKADFYKEAEEILKEKHGKRIDFYGWKRAN
jgi:hypothetical protein